MKLTCVVLWTACTHVYLEIKLVCIIVMRETRFDF